MISGEYLASELYGMRSDRDDRDFAEDILGVTQSESNSSKSGKLRDSSGNLIPYSASLNEKMYIVECPDILVPSADASTTAWLTFNDGGRAAQLVNGRKGKTVVMSVPFEAITDAPARDRLMKQFLSL